MCDKKKNNNKNQTQTDYVINNNLHEHVNQRGFPI